VLPLIPPAEENEENRGPRSEYSPRSDCPPHVTAIQMELPPTAVAGRLRLAPGQMAVFVTVLFGYGGRQWLAAMTSSVLRPDMFRIVMEAAPSDAAAGNLTAARHLMIVDDQA
jgi:hypothetical protein